MSTRKIVQLHESDTLALPLANGCALRVTAFRLSPRIALTIHGPAGGDRGGVILGAARARLLASWLARLADAMDETGDHDLPSPRRLPDRRGRCYSSPRREVP